MLRKKLLCFFCICVKLIALSFAQSDSSQRIININSADLIEYTSQENDKTENGFEHSSEASTINASETQNQKETLSESESTTKSESPTEDSTDAKNKIEVIILTGNVSISVTDGKVTDMIYADRIIYNRTRNTVKAEGNVQYKRLTAGSVSQSFVGEGILFDIKDMSGIFLAGVVETSSQKANLSSYVVHSELTGRDASGVIAFKNAKLTTSTSEEPLWSINASRLWLLPGDELSFANGYYSIGVVPILYLPFFYYPADEMIFHPVFGYRPKGGYFVQTTTYVLGRKPISTTDSNSTFANFLSSDTLKEQKRNGLFLQNLDASESNTNTDYIKIIADAYSALGFLLGVDGNVKVANFMNPIKFSTYLGFSHTLYPLSSYGIFSMYDALGDSKFNSSNLFGWTLPFRYNLNFSTGFNVNPINFQISLPLISDPFFTSDFLSRSEDMNWFKFMLNQEESNAITNEQTSYNWLLKFALTPSTSKVAPYLQSFSLSNLSTTISFGSKINQLLTGEDAIYSPERKFYFPQSIKPEASVSFSGTIFSTSMLNSKRKLTQVNGLENPFSNNAKNSETILDENKEKEAANSNTKSNTSNPIDLFLPLFRSEKNNTTLNKSISYALNYTINGNFFSEHIYNSSQWKEIKNISWKDFYSHHYKLSYNIKLSSSLNIFSNILKLDNTLDFSQNFQRTPFVVETTRKENIDLNDYKVSVFKLTNTNTLSVTPFYFSDIFKGSQLQWSISEVLFKSNFTGTVASPTWEKQSIKWDKDFITSHSLTSLLSVNIQNYTQSFKLTSNLPPVLSSFAMSGNFQHPYGSVTMDTRVYEKEGVTDKWFWAPFSVSLNWKLPFNISTSQTYGYNIEETSSETFRFSFAWKYLSLNFTMQRDMQYILDVASGWKINGTTKKFGAKSLDFSFSNSSDKLKFTFWKNRIALSFFASSVLSINFQRATESYFTFSPTVEFSIHEFLTLRFSATTRNDVIARYFQKYLNLGVTIPGETNIFKDLAQSFYFWDINARKASGFKIKSFNIELQHDLKDWTLSFAYSFLPKLAYNSTTSRNEYSYEPKITFMVTWKPINDIRVKTTTDDKGFTVEHGTIK